MIGHFGVQNNFLGGAMMPATQQQQQSNALGTKPLCHIDELEKRILDIRSMAGEPTTGIESSTFEQYNAVINSNFKNSNFRFEPCKFVYYMKEMKEVGEERSKGVDEAFDEDSADQKAQLENKLENDCKDPKKTSAERNIATSLCVRAVKGIDKLKNHITPPDRNSINSSTHPPISKKLQELEEKKEKINQKLETLKNRVTDCSNKFFDIKMKQKGLYRKLLNTLYKVECVRKLTQTVDDRERQMEEKLIEIERNLRGPFTDIQLLSSMKGTASVGSNIEINDAKIDRDSLKKILELLEPQRQGLEHLSNVTKNDNYHADEMINKIKQQNKDKAAK